MIILSVWIRTMCYGIIELIYEFTSYDLRAVNGTRIFAARKSDLFREIHSLPSGGGTGIPSLMNSS